MRSSADAKGGHRDNSRKQWEYKKYCARKCENSNEAGNKEEVPHKEEEVDTTAAKEEIIETGAEEEEEETEEDKQEDA